MRAVVVGAGIGGLCTALGLLREGLEVRVLERAPEPGGKLRPVVLGGRRVDAGPTVLTMRWVFEDLFASLGESLSAWVPLTSADVLARHAFADGSTLDLYTDVERSAAAIEALAGAGEAQAYRRFAAYAERIYREVEAPFLLGPRPTFTSVLADHGLRGMLRLLSIDAQRSMWRALSAQFRDPRLVQLFARYATYSGSSALSAPATLNLIAHVERAGVSYVEGGMARLGDGLARLLVARGGQLRTGAPVAEIECASGHVRGVRLEDGERLEAEVVVANCDAAALAGGLLGEAARVGPRAPTERERSLSAVTWALSATARGFPLVRHNVFFSADYRRELGELFDALTTPADPTIYVCAQDRGDAPADAGGAERMLVLCNAPARDRAWTAEEISRCEEQTFARLQRAGLTLEVAARERRTPEDFDRLFPATRGALYGRATRGMWTPFTRPGCRSPIAGLYRVGGSVHPGAGVPMAALSARVAVASVIADHGSIARSPTAGTPGGTSTS